MMLKVVFLSMILAQFSLVSSQSSSLPAGFFPFAVDTSLEDIVLQNTLTTFDQETLTADFINSGLGSLKDNHFQEETYPVTDYAIFQGLDDTSMFATSVSVGEQYAAVGANGYDSFNGAVYVYSVNSGTWTLQAVIQSPDSFNSNFGLCVVVDGDNIMISANGQNAFTGRVYVYTLNSYNVWILTATIQSPLGTFESFGYSLDLSGNNAVIGTASGYAFIYQNIDDQWVLVKSLSSQTSTDYFGRAVAAYGDTIVIGASGYQNTAGSVYVYSQVGVGDWTLTSTIKSVTGFNSQFGFAVAIYNYTIAVGAPGYIPGNYDNAGVQTANNIGWVYAYDYSPLTGEWALNQSIQSPAGNNSYFGVSVKVSNYRLAIGADGYPSGNSTGLSYVYSRIGPKGEWQRNVYFPSPAGFNSHFGAAIDVSDYYVAIGAYAFDDLRGSVYLATLPYLFEPSASPTQAPVAINSNSPPNAIGDLSAGVVAAIFLSGFLFLGLIALIIYFCCCRAAPLALDKKKKKEEEDSPYTVHTFNGYSEMDGNNAPPAPHPSMYPSFMYPPPPPMDKKDDKKTIDKADPGFLRRLFPYKVYSYRGYQEGSDDQLPAVKEENQTPYNHNLRSQDNLSYTAHLPDIRPPSNVSGFDLTAFREDLKKLQQQGEGSMGYGGPHDAIAEEEGEGEQQEEGEENQDPPADEVRAADEVMTISTMTGTQNLESAQARYAKYLAAARSGTNNRPVVSSKRSKQPLQTASIELDVALTEPMKLMAVQEAREKNMKSESVDPEARGNDLAQQDEVNRLRSVEAARSLNAVSADEEQLRFTELNRLKEEEKLRNEEKVRARYALFKAKAEDTASVATSKYNEE